MTADPVIPDLTAAKIGVVGLGYVGLPLAVAFGRQRVVVGYDINQNRVQELNAGHDNTREITSLELEGAQHLSVTSNPQKLADCGIFIVTVPTPVDAHKRPNLNHLIAASQTVGEAISPGSLVIFESTVYPGATEEECIPVIEAVSGLVFNIDFFAGYSPERINPGDKTHKLTDIVKVTSGSTPKTAIVVDDLYRQIVSAGTFKAVSIKTAEAAKVIENTQRDLNIALVNELALIFDRMGLDTSDVLEAAGTKWNFLPFRPGLVGGHCIGVDPYYLTHKAQELGYHPEVVLAGRRMNDGMGAFVARQLVKHLICRDQVVKGAKVLVLGLAFKENCPDLRNTGVLAMIRELQSWAMTVDVCDPEVGAQEAKEAYGLDLISPPEKAAYDAVILAVGHKVFKNLGAKEMRKFGKNGRHVFFDIKSVFGRTASDWRL